MKSKTNETLTPGAAYTILTNIRLQAVTNKNPMVESQAEIGEMLRNPSMTEEIIVHAAETLSLLVANDPQQADPEAMRRLAKFFIHGPVENKEADRKAGEFKAYNVSKVMTDVACALTGYAAAKTELTGEETGLMWQTIEASSKYTMETNCMKRMEKILSFEHA